MNTLTTELCITAGKHIDYAYYTNDSFPYESSDEELMNLTQTFIADIPHPVFVVGKDSQKIVFANNFAAANRQELLKGLFFDEVVQVWGQEIGGLTLSFFDKHWYSLHTKDFTWQGDSYQVIELRKREDIPDTETLKTWKNMIAVMLHRFRSPLTGIGGYFDMLREGNTDEATEKKFSAIQNGFDKLYDMMDELELLYNIPGEGTETAAAYTNVELIAKGVVLSYPADVKKRLKLNINSEDTGIRCTPANLQFILKSLIQNAVEHSDEGDILIDFSADKGKSITVCNKGEVIPEHLTSQIFYPFITTKTINLGIGLTQAYLYARQCSGTIVLKENSAEKGICFSVCFPD